jgi:hypothetical protein
MRETSEQGRSRKRWKRRIGERWKQIQAETITYALVCIYAMVLF